jgi:putative membrane protein
MVKFNPHPIVAITKTILISLILSALVYFTRNVLGDLYTTLMLIVWAFAIFMVLLSILLSKFHTLSLEENSITYHSGLLSIRQVTLPYSKISEASFHQDLIQRIFGIGTLKIDTAGGADVAILVHDIKRSDLNQILGEVKRKSGTDSI